MKLINPTDNIYFIICDVCFERKDLNDKYVLYRVVWANTASWYVPYIPHVRHICSGILFADL